MTGLQIEHEVEDGVGILRLSGEARTETVMRFREAANAVRMAGARSYIIDMARLDFLDSASLSVLLTLRALAIEEGGRMVLSQPRRIVQRVFDSAGLAHIFQFASDESEARMYVRAL